MSNHTAGPWHVYVNTVEVGNKKGVDVRSEVDLYGKVCRDCTLEDAQLIAAAPELLAACKAALERWGMHSCGEVKLLVDAIEKAEGK